MSVTSATPIAPTAIGLTKPQNAGDIAPAFLHEIDPGLLDAAAKAPVDAIVVFKAPTDNPRAHAALQALAGAEALPRGAERKTVVFDALKKISDTSISAKSDTLTALTKSKDIQGIDPLWAFNSVRVRGATAEALRKIIGPDVQMILPDAIIAWPQMPNGIIDPIEGVRELTPGKTTPKTSDPSAPTAPDPKDPNAIWIDWGTMKMNAPSAWKQGITGAGIVVGDLDTGVDLDHSGLKANFRGTKADGTQDMSYNWHNSIEKTDPGWIDDVGHGSHTTGSVVGNDAHHLTGVAPDAKFVAARALGLAGGSMFALLDSMQWMTAPTDSAGKNPRPDLAPDIVTNSWGGGPTGNSFLWMALRNWRRAGIVPVFAAGNARNPNPGEVAVPGLYDETITVGASNPDDTRAYFSMYGPSKYSNGPKPEITAPGTKIYSTTPDGEFHDTIVENGKQYPWSGTSMATPHLAGAVALYLQAHPNAGFDEIRTALEQAGTHPDAVSQSDGYGRVQVDKLITAATIDKNAKLADPKRVEELMKQVAAAQVYPGDPVLPPTVTPPPAS